MRMVKIDCVSNCFLTQEQIIYFSSTFFYLGTRNIFSKATSFLEEAVLMKDFSHTNILSLIGIVVREERPYAILPFMEYGDLKSYIRDPEKV